MFNNLIKFGNKTALIDYELGNLTFKEIIKETKRIQNKLNSENIVLLVASNSLESVTGYIAFLNHPKTITILVDKSFKSKFINGIINLYKPNFIFAPKEFKFEVNTEEITVKKKSYKLHKTFFKKFKKINFKNFLLLSTSGTTQNPKFVRLSKQNILSNTKNIISYLSIKSSHTTITTMPMGYSYGLSIINTHLFAGSKILLNEKTIFESEFWKRIRENKISSFGGVPEFYEYLKKLKFEKQNISSLVYITQAGGKMNEEYLKYLGNICSNFNIKFFVMYGQTEASPRMSYLDWKKFNVKPNSIGKPLKGCHFELLDENKKKINKKNTIGEIVFYGKNVCLGYANSQKDLQKGDENKKKLFTGDLGVKDKDNYFYIVGRKNRIIKLFGKRCNLKDIENFLKIKGIKANCYQNDKKLQLNLLSNHVIEKVKNDLSEYLGINKNFILIKKNNINTFKVVKNYEK